MESFRPRVGFLPPEEGPFWKDVTKILFYASQVDESRTTDLFVTTILDRFDVAAARMFSATVNFDDPNAARNLPWASYRNGEEANTFSGLAAQFAILPYVRHKFTGKPADFHPVPRKNSVPLLEQAIFGPEKFNIPAIPNAPKNQPISKSQRLQVIECLLQRGARQTGVLSLVKKHRLQAKKKANIEYLDNVMELLNRYRAVGGERRAYVKRLLGLNKT
jgi:hypothetical protein